ncbi:MAG: hypothetical protein OWU32_10575 [Firmicutes bacterium]|nr:hypothetical protein [Bacillota bacterium]
MTDVGLWLVLLAFSIVWFVPLLWTVLTAFKSLTVGLTLLTQMGEAGAQWQMIAAGTLIVALPLFVVFVLFQRQFVESFMRSGMK